MEGTVLGAFSDRDTPDPIPNSAVKPISADGSLLGKSKSVPRTVFFKKNDNDSLYKAVFCYSNYFFQGVLCYNKNTTGHLTFLSMSRLFRQFLIAAPVLLLLIALLFWVYSTYLRTPPTCNDGIQNQDEEGIDCGGSVCVAACQVELVGEALQSQEVVFIPVGNNHYDVLGKLYNPNDTLGASTFRYTFILKGANGEVVAERSGESYILPQEGKNLIEVNLESTVAPRTVELTTSDITWERFSGYQEKPSIPIYQKRYTVLPPGPVFSEVFGLLSNESPYDFRSIIVKVILRDAMGKPLAINKTRQDNIRAGEKRDFTLVFPIPFLGSVEKVDMEVDADVYHSQNFVKQYFPTGEERQR